MATTPLNERTLLKLLATLGKKKRKRFRKYLQAPLHGPNATVVKLLDLLERWLNGSRKKPLTFEQTQKSLGIAANTLEKNISVTLSALRKFIREEAEEEQGLHNHGLALEFLYWQDLDQKELEIEYRNYAKKLGQLPESSARLYQELSLFEKLCHIRVDNNPDKHNAAFEEYLVRLEEFYVASRLKYVCGVINSSQIFRQEQAWPDVEAMVKRLKAMGGRLSLMGEAYYRTAMLLQNKKPERKEMEEMFQYLNQNCRKIAREEGIALFGFLLNTVLRQIEYRKEPLLEFICDIYDSMIHHDLLLEKGFIESWHLRNYVLTNIKLKRNEAATRFFQEYSPFLRQADARTLVPEIGGHLTFQAEDYPACIAYSKQILQLAGIGARLELTARMLIWRSYFGMYEELGMDGLDKMQQQYESIRVFLQREGKLSEANRARYRLFTRLFFKLIRQLGSPKGKARREALDAIRRELEGNPQMVFREWLFEAIEKRM